LALSKPPATIYADAASTTPVRREVLEAMWPYLTAEFGNPSSAHALGRAAAAALDTARTRVAGAFGAMPGEVVFTSGGTEANHLGIVGMALAKPGGRHVVTSPIEHSSVLGAVDWLRRWHGFEVTLVDVEPDGTVTPEALAAAMRPDTTLVSIQHANSEVGTVQPLAALVAAARAAAPGALFHTDAVQSAAWLDTSLEALGVDALSIAGHKLGGPKGIGALLIRRGVALEPLLTGGGQEGGRRSGTENVAGAVGLGAAAKIRPTLQGVVAECRDSLIEQVLASVPNAILTGPCPRGGRYWADVGGAMQAEAGAQRPACAALTPERRAGRHMTARLPGHASFCFPGTHGTKILTDLERQGVLASSGTACSAGRDEPSPVLLALGINSDVAVTSIRMTFDEPFDAARVAAAIRRAVAP
jgi:cysteine desulfurase